MQNKVLIVIVIMLLSTSCIVQSPKYTTIGQVMSLQLGMTKAKVEEILGVQPYDIKSFNDTCNVFIYVYRVSDRSTLSFYTKLTNGWKSVGKYAQLDVAYSKDGKVIKIESCRYCPDNLVAKSKVDFAKIFVFVTVTLPVILIFIGLKL